MTRKLEEEFNLPPLEEVLPVEKKESKEITEPSSILALFQRDPIETWQLMMVPIFGHDGEYTYPESADGCVSTPLSHKHTYIHDQIVQLLCLKPIR